MSMQDQVEQISRMMPEFTEEGFKKVRMPLALFEAIKAAREYSLIQGDSYQEGREPGMHNSQVIIENDEEQVSRVLYTYRKTMIVLNDTTQEVISKTLGGRIRKNTVSPSKSC